jgi:hypothetical protein
LSLAAGSLAMAQGAPDTPGDSVAARLPALFGAAMPETGVPWWPGMPLVRFAPGLTRYNRIEALSFAAVAGRELDSARRVAGLLRLGIADVVPNAELEFKREVQTRSLALSVFHRLTASNLWGNPLALGSSLGALIIGRDDGFYYRAGGVELTMVDSSRGVFESRLFVERHRSARPKNDFSFADVLGERPFRPNIAAENGDMIGAAVLINRRFGELAVDPRLFVELRLEGAFGDFDYTRGMVEATGTLPLFGVVLPGLTVAAGMSGGTPPLQRLWYVGGSRSARGQPPGVMVGDAFWMTQIEIGTTNAFARPVVFLDMAWAGDRNDITSPGRVASGAGVGVSLFDGSLRLDIARGIRPATGVRGALYLEARM